MGKEQFDDFCRQETASLVAFVRRAGGVGHEQAKDAVQEALTRAYPQWAQLEHPRAWIRTVAYRVAQAEGARAKDGLLRAVAGGWAVSTHHDPDVIVLAHEHEQLLQDLGTLPLRQRLVMAWHLDGFDTAEIAEQLGMPPATVRSNLRHARNALRALFQARGQRRGGLL